jgi:tetratricopeptide (TPR) repeat protein
MAAYYAEANAWRTEALVALGRADEAKRVAEDAEAVADKVLAQRPGYRLALHAQQLLVGQLAGASMLNLDPLNAIPNAKRAVQISLTLLEFDPGNIVTTNNLAVARTYLGDAHWTAGKLREALPYYDQSVKDGLQVTSGGPNLYVTSFFTLAYVALRHAQIGDISGAGAIIDSGKPYLDRLRQSTPQGSTALTVVDMENRLAVASVAQQRGDDAAARRIATDAERELQGLKVKGGVEEFQKNTLLFWAGLTAGQSAMVQKDYADAEQQLRTALAGRNAQGTTSMDDRRTEATISSWLAMALARQGKSAEAAKLLAPAVKYERELAARNHGDVWVPFELGTVLYAQALADRAQAPALLHEAAALLDSLPADLRNTHDVRLVRDFIGAERAASR